MNVSRRWLEGFLRRPLEADDLVREADRFLAVVERSLGLVPHVSTATRAVAMRAG